MSAKTQIIVERVRERYSERQLYLRSLSFTATAYQGRVYSAQFCVS